MNLDELKRQECLDLLDNVPSILYSLIPDINTGYREYDILFASNYISEQAAIKMHWEYGMKLNYLFAALQDQRVGSSLFGQLFESIVLEAITTKKINKFEGNESEQQAHESEQQAFSLTFGDFEIGTYDDNNPDAVLSSVCNSTKNMLLTPIHLNAAAVDTIFFNAATKTIHFLQMTISSYHGFKLKHLQNLARALNIRDKTQIKMVFVVPENCYHNFRKQPALKSKGGVYLKSYSGFRQYVLSVPSRLFGNVDEMIVG